jgi:hypothetical protein
MFTHLRFNFFVSSTVISSVVIRIRINLVVLYPDPDPFCESGSRFRSMEIDKNEQINMVSCLSKRLRMYLCF